MNKSNSITEIVAGFSKPLLIEMCLDLVEVQFRCETAGWILRIIIDRKSGVTLEDCTVVSREISRFLEVENPIDQPYNLEVSSPGLDRPLKQERDFIQCKGRRAKVITTATDNGDNHLIGVIKDFTQNKLFLTTEQGELQIPYGQIVKAKLIIDF